MMRYNLLIAFTLLSALVIRPGTASAAPDRIVVMISVDGLAHYYLDDANAEMPTIRRLAAQGTRASMMKASVPSVTWPNHTTLVTGVQPGRHGVVGNNYFDRASGKVVTLITDPVFDKDQIVKVPTIYDLAKENGLTTAALVWPASRGAKSLDWTVPDVATQQIFDQYSTPHLLKECKEAGIPVDKQGEFHRAGRADLGDQLSTQMFNLVIHQHRPNLALLHLVNVDHIEHLKGPQTPEAYAAIKAADEQVGQICDQLQKDFPGKATVVIVSDHGFFPIRQSIFPNVILHKAGLLDVKGLQIHGGQVRAVSQGGSALVYVLDAADRQSLLQRAESLFKDVEGVEKVVTEQGFAEYGLSLPQVDPHAPDLVLFAKNGYTFGDTAGGELAVTAKSAELRGTHGHDPNQPGMHATFVAWGAGIKPGTKLDEISNADVAPTVAALLGLQMKNVEGKVLESSLAAASEHPLSR